MRMSVGIGVCTTLEKLDRNIGSNLRNCLARCQDRDDQSKKQKKTQLERRIGHTKTRRRQYQSLSLLFQSLGVEFEFQSSDTRLHEVGL